MHSCIHNWIATCCNSRHLCDFYRPTVKHKCEETKSTANNLSAMLAVCWDIGTRTQNNRTRICCVANYTISQSMYETFSVRHRLF